MDELRFLIEGIGGIGGVMAARLIQAGYSPTLVTNNRDITDAINTSGLQVTVDGDTVAVPASAVTSPGDTRGPFDVALLIMKADGVVAAAEVTFPLLAPNGFVVTFQNGVVEDDVAAAIGADRIVSGIVGWGGTMHAPGVYEQTSKGSIHIGEIDNPPTQRLVPLATALEAVAPVVVSDNIRGALWSKLAINATINTLGALTGQTLGELLAGREARTLLLAAYREVVDTATALEIRLERIAADPYLLYLPEGAGPATRFRKDLLVRLVGRKYRNVKSSSLQSLERGRRTEVDYLNGYVVEQARLVNVPVPVNDALVHMVHEIETGKRPIDPVNLAELPAKIG